MLQVAEAMRRHRQFILYRLVPGRREGKLDKLPVDWRSGQVCDAHDPAVWTDADTAAATADAWGCGVGFVFTEALGLWFLDIDNCLTDAGTWSELAVQLLGALPGCAVEVSASGRGLHVFGSGALPPHATRDTGRGLELYHTARFVALTGTSLQGDAATVPAPEVLAWLVANYFPPRAIIDSAVNDWRTEPVAEWSGPADDEQLIARMLRTSSAAAAFGGKASLRDLWEGNADALARVWPSPSSDAYDRSSADMALANHLRYWTGNDHERMRRLMLRSGLVRDKWEARPDYLADTVRGAVSTRVLQDRPPATVPGVPASGEEWTPTQMDGTEAALAVEFAKHARGRLAWSPVLDWVVRAGPVWEPDETLQRERAMRRVCDTAKDGQVASTVKTLGKHSTVRAALNEARSDPRLQVTADAWDADPMALNTPGGVVDLRTGVMRPHAEGDHFLKVTAVAPASGMPERWLRFLTETFQGDAAMLEFMQRSIGYWLSGDRSAKVFWYLWGHGDTGKSVLMDTLGALIGSYGHVLAPDAIIEQRSGARHPADIAKLDGKRLATTAELPSGAHLNQALLKNLTGDRTVSARGMGENPRDIILSHKHVLSSNHKVQLPGGDQALERRLLLVPFRNRVPLARQDPDLLEALLAEGPGILAWAIEGAAKWHRDGGGKLGLRVPASVAGETAAYMREENDVAQWFDECCRFDPVGLTTSAEAYGSYRLWKQARGASVESQKVWAPRLLASEPRLQPVKASTMRYRGMVLLAPNGAVPPVPTATAANTAIPIPPMVPSLPSFSNYYAR